ncbi:MAG: ankyrin repeat domain-containing protein [Pirellulales bacterium]|nr:ankyrin repeat domain-containing protein [Pirellulales bacterium]
MFHSPSAEALRFHRIVAEGDLQELSTALEHGADVDAPGYVGMTALMLTVGSRDLEKTKLLIQHGADPELADDFNATALRHAVDADFTDGVRLLLSLGVDRGHHPRYPLKKIDYHESLLEELAPFDPKGDLSETEWRESIEQSKQSARDRGQNPTVTPIISDVQSVEVLKLFLEAGDDLNLAPNEVKRAMLGLETGRELRIAPSDYRRHKSPRHGSQNPERMDFPFWQEMIRTGVNAHSAREQFNDHNPSAEPGAVWCYDRFGSSLTPLDDGRFVQIAGEHEDYYDPDFFIYNDVVIHDGKGDFQIYGYPQDVFPPTDFHTATLCRDGIYIVGCLGHPTQRRSGYTPVYRLMLESWRITPVETAGEMPGWIHGHRASYDPDRNSIRIVGGEIQLVADDETPRLVPNEHEFELDLTRLQWRLMA